MKLDADEKELLESVERGEWKSAGGGKRERTRYTRYAKATFRKDRRSHRGHDTVRLHGLSRDDKAGRAPTEHTVRGWPTKAS